MHANLDARQTDATVLVLAHAVCSSHLLGAPRELRHEARHVCQLVGRPAGLLPQRHQPQPLARVALPPPPRRVVVQQAVLPQQPLNLWGRAKSVY